jgi:Rrf2 family iron-sulfur cluster assembly transcriptional regulator
MSYLAEVYDSGEERPISSAEIAQTRNMPAPLAAKLLSEVSSAGLALGTTGPGGGYRLAKPPEEICLADIVWIFERKEQEYPCPFGPGWCGNKNPCPLHDDFEKLESSAERFLMETTLAVFVKGEDAE